VLAVVALPLIPVLTVAAALWRRRRAHRPGAGPVAWAAVCVLWAFAFVTGFSIGLFVLPVVGLLAIACAAAYWTPSPSGSSVVTLSMLWQTRTTSHGRGWLPYLLLAAAWFFVSAIVPGPAVILAFVVAVIGLTAGFVRYHHDPAGSLPNIVYVGISLLVGSATVVLASVAVT
jgi:hypothetical protein